MRIMWHITCEFYFDCLLFFKKCRKVILETKIDHDLNALFNGGKMIFLRKNALLIVASKFLQTLRKLTAKLQLTIFKHWIGPRNYFEYQINGIWRF